MAFLKPNNLEVVSHPSMVWTCKQQVLTNGLSQFSLSSLNNPSTPAVVLSLPLDESRAYCEQCLHDDAEVSPSLYHLQQQWFFKFHYCA